MLSRVFSGAHDSSLAPLTLADVDRLDGGHTVIDGFPASDAFR
ncbi:MAG: hypothetical protein ACTSU5_18395 [Promethearchaeota archaeon]